MFVVVYLPMTRFVKRRVGDATTLNGGNADSLLEQRICRADISMPSSCAKACCGQSQNLCAIPVLESCVKVSPYYFHESIWGITCIVDSFIKVLPYCVIDFLGDNLGKRLSIAIDEIEDNMQRE